MYNSIASKIFTLMISSGKYKIIRHKPKKGVVYPLIRLPQSEAHVIGETAHVFKTEYKGKPVYIISLDEEFSGVTEVVQPEEKVVQPNVKSDLELKIEKLEKEVYHTSKQEKELDGPAEIRTQDPRRVKAMS